MKPALIGDLHPREATPDDVLLLNLHHRVTSFIDEASDIESFVAYVVTANGRGRCLLAGPKPPADQDEACKALARRLHDKVRPATRFSWVVCLAGWLHGNEEAAGRYDQLLMVPKDAHGDMPFVVDCVDKPADILAGLDNLADQCAESVKLYRLHLEAADVRPEHMRQHANGRHADPRMVEATLVMPGPMSEHRRPRVRRGFVAPGLKGARGRSTH